MEVSIFEACKIINSINFKPILEIEPIENCLNRVVAENIYAKMSLPRFNNSAMDGYGIKIKNSNFELKVVDCIYAGLTTDREIGENECIKIMTGARVPSSVEAIIPKEDCREIDGKIVIEKSFKLNQHIRFIGEDVSENELLIAEGEKINYSHIGLLASQGITHLRIYKKPKVAIFGTGEEIKYHYESLEPSQIYNSNTPSMLKQAENYGALSVFLGNIKDNKKDLLNLVENLQNFDMIVTSGGVSVGDKDFTKDVFLESGMELFFDKIEMKPGKPTTFGKINNCFILNLPGNPLACMVNFNIFGRLIINNLLKLKSKNLSFIETKISSDFYLKKGRDSVICGFFDGCKFHVSEKNSPGMVSVISKCNGAIIVDKSRDSFKVNESVKFLPFNFEFLADEFLDFITK
ncbi:MAG: molybdopterin molybdotransferase MoeA [Campylobacterales bacterium]|nr:molybdopterin molybdotransferase MoeA [Campylobacterales bacterium]